MNPDKTLPTKVPGGNLGELSRLGRFVRKCKRPCELQYKTCRVSAACCFGFLNGCSILSVTSDKRNERLLDRHTQSPLQPRIVQVSGLAEYLVGLGDGCLFWDDPGVQGATDRAQAVQGVARPQCSA